MKNKEYKVTDHLPEAERRFVDFKRYEISFRRWLIGQIDSGYLTFEEARDKFKLPSYDYRRILRLWQERYSETFNTKLSMLDSEKLTDIHQLHTRIKELEAQLELSTMRVVALQTVIDVAEHDLKLDIKKKSGPS